MLTTKVASKTTLAIPNAGGTGKVSAPSWPSYTKSATSAVKNHHQGGSATPTNVRSVPTRHQSQQSPTTSAYTAPTAIPGSTPKPIYPRAARRSRVEGQCIVEITVGADGRVNAVRISRSSGHGLLDQAALAGIASWRFNPARRGSQTVTGTVRVPITFRLE